MSIAKLLEQQKSFLAEADKGARFDAPELTVLAMPLQLQERRQTSLQQKIARLEQEKADTAARIDAAIKSLKEELAGLGKKIAADRKALEPVLKAAGGSKVAPTAPKATPAPAPTPTRTPAPAAATTKVKTTATKAATKPK